MKGANIFALLIIHVLIQINTTSTNTVNTKNNGAELHQTCTCPVNVTSTEQQSNHTKMLLEQKKRQLILLNQKRAMTAVAIIVGLVVGSVLFSQMWKQQAGTSTSTFSEISDTILGTELRKRRGFHRKRFHRRLRKTSKSYKNNIEYTPLLGGSTEENHSV